MQQHDEEIAPAKVLCVDDEPAILRSLKRLLRRDGYEVILAEGGQAALDALKEHDDIACLVCDQRMPEIDGPAVLTACYQTQPNTYRITLTGYTDIAAAQRSINEGRVNLFLTKPWEDQQVRQAVAEGVKQYGLVAENQRLQKLTHDQNRELAEWNKTLETRVDDRTAEVRKRSEQAVALLKQIQVTLDDSVSTMASMLEMLEPEKAAHANRVSVLCQRMAFWLELDEKTQRDAAIAGRLHEIGCLSAAGCRLRQDEDASHRLPPVREIGFGMLSRVSGFKQIALAVRDQDEWFNGSESPNDKKGSSIPIIARLLAVAKTYDEAVYASGQVDRPDVCAGSEALKAERGGRLDTKLVDLLLDHVKASTVQSSEMEVSVFEAGPNMTVLDDIRDVDDRLLLKSGSVLDRDTLLRLRRMAKGGQVCSMLRVAQNSQRDAA